MAPVHSNDYLIFISGSVYFLILVWNPGISLNLQNMTKQTTTTGGPGTNRTITTIMQEVPVKIINKTSFETVTSADKKTKTTTENVTLLPQPGQTFKLQLDPLFALTNHEIRLVIAALFGVLGGSAHAIASLTTWISRDKLTKGWDGGILAAHTLEQLSGSPTAINDFGVAGISALAGLMTDEITRKLRDVLDTLFGIDKPPGEKGESPDPYDDYEPITMIFFLCIWIGNFIISSKIRCDCSRVTFS